MSHFSRGPRTGSAPAGAAPPAPPTGASPSGRRFGELLVEDNVISAAQLEALLRLQAVAPSYTPLGQLVLLNKFITRKQLQTLLHRYRKRSRLGAILVKSGRITAAQLQEALADQSRTRRPIGQVLMRLGYVNETTMRDALCTQLQINFFDLDPIAIDRSLARLISERFAMRHLLLPLFRVDNVLVVAMDDPSQAALVESLEESLRLHIETVTTTTEKLKAAMLRLYGPPSPPDVDVFKQRNVLVGPVRDPFVIELASKALRGVIFLPLAWQ